MDECTLELEPYCVELTNEMGNITEAVNACIVGSQGCNRLEVVESCDGRVCAGGRCQDECFDECEAGEGYCDDLNSPVTCQLNERGCGTWIDLDDCLSDQVCAGEGVCVSQDLDWGVIDFTITAGSEAGAEAGDIPNPTPPPPPPSDWVGYNGPHEVTLSPRTRGGCTMKRSHTYPAPPLLLLFFGLYLLLKRRHSLDIG